MIPCGRRRDITARVGNQLRHAGWRLGRWGAGLQRAHGGCGVEDPQEMALARAVVSVPRRWLGGPMPSLPDGERPSFSEAMLGTLDHWTQELLADIQQGTGRTP